eukprot:s889_g10.t1
MSYLGCPQPRIQNDFSGALVIRPTWPRATAAQGSTMSTPFSADDESSGKMRIRVPKGLPPKKMLGLPRENLAAEVPSRNASDSANGLGQFI